MRNSGQFYHAKLPKMTEKKQAEREAAFKREPESWDTSCVESHRPQKVGNHLFSAVSVTRKIEVPSNHVGLTLAVSTAAQAAQTGSCTVKVLMFPHANISSP